MDPSDSPLSATPADLSAASMAATPTYLMLVDRLQGGVLLTGALTMSFLGLAVRVKTRRPGVQYTESYDVSKMVMARSLQLNVTTVLSILKRII